MIRKLWHLRVPLMALLALPLVGCGWAEWPPPAGGSASAGNPVVLRNAPVVFVGADAVTVGKGDTVYSISRRHNVSVRAIIQANRLTPPYYLTVGRRLVLRRRRVYVVKRGDTLSRIARAHNLNVYGLARINRLRPPYLIRVDERLFLPRSARSARSVRPVAVRTAAKSKPPPKAAPSVPRPPRKPVSAAAGKTVARVIAPPPPISGKGFLWPVRGRVISGFGSKSKGLQNDGINIAAKRGAPVRAAENGVVAYAGNELRGFGNLLLIKHSGGWITAYAHNDKLMVNRGDKIRKGQYIATVGSTGSVKTPQLHFELRRGKRAIDPLTMLPKLGPGRRKS